MPLNDFQQELCSTSTWDFTDLRALFVNCTLKPSPDLSNTQGLMDISVAIMEANGVASISSAPSTTTSRPACTRT